LTLNKQLQRKEQQSLITGGGARITKRTALDRKKTDVYKLEMKKLFFMVFLICFLLNFESFVLEHQKSSREGYQAKLRNEWLKKVPLPKYAVELEWKFSFPSEDLIDKDIYFYGARSISSDSAENIYVSDSKAHRVLKFNSSGNYLQQIGHKGKGPGEFSYGPFNVTFADNSLIVRDSGRIQSFDENGKYVKSFKLSKIYHDIVISDKGLILAAPFSYTEQSHLIDVLSKEGEILYSFGELKRFKHSQHYLNRVRLALTHHGELLVAFVHFPIIRKYSIDGEFLLEFRIEHEAIKSQEKINQKRISAQKKAGIGFIEIITAIKTIRDSIYVLHTVPRIKIFEFDNDGKQKSQYWYTRPYGYSVTDFLIRNKANEKLFYFLQVTPENKIEVFAPRHKGEKVSNFSGGGVFRP